MSTIRQSEVLSYSKEQHRCSHIIVAPSVHQRLASHSPSFGPGVLFFNLSSVWFVWRCWPLWSHLEYRCSLHLTALTPIIYNFFEHNTSVPALLATWVHSGNGDPHYYLLHTHIHYVTAVPQPTTTNATRIRQNDPRRGGGYNCCAHCTSFKQSIQDSSCQPRPKG